MSGRFSRLLRSLLVPGSLRSRAQERWCVADSFPSGAYNHHLLRSRASGDFIRHPDFLWSPTPYWTARAGLNAHFRELADRLDGAVYSDALVVLHPEDHARSRASWLESWDQAAEEELADCWERLVDDQGWARAMPGRRFRLRVIPDGDSSLGRVLGLEPGEFATGLLPNLYFGPQEDSVPLAEVFVRQQGGDFRSVGTFWSDQLAFSVGAHGLDNGLVPSLADSAVYTVHRFPGEQGLHHKLNPERADRLALQTGKALGGETVRIVDRGREDKVLLEVMLVAARHPAAEVDGRAARGAALDLPGMGIDLPGMGIPAGTILPGDLDLGTLGAVSIIPDALPEPVHALSERGVLLQRVHFRKLMAGYYLHLDRSGRVGPRTADPVARLEVRDDRVSLIPEGRDLCLDGRPLPQGEAVPLEGREHSIRWPEGQTTWTDLRRPADKRWPYLGRVEVPRRTVPLFGGGSYRVGRDREACDIALPDRPTAENILWRDGRLHGEVEVQGGRVDRAGFRTDAICVATQAAELDLRGDSPGLRNLSASCPLHVRRGDGEIVRLKQDADVVLRRGDELLLGNQAFVLVGPGEPEVEAVREPEPRSIQIGPLRVESERLEAGPGSRGRRPRVGGARGRLVDHSKTVGALLGISPAAEKSGAVPMGSGRPAPALAGAFDLASRADPSPTRADSWSRGEEPLSGLAEPAPAVEDVPEIDGWSDPDGGLPTDFLPTLDLDPPSIETVAILEELGPVPLSFAPAAAAPLGFPELDEVGPTIVDDPGARPRLRARPAAAPEPAPISPLAVKKALPRGLRIGPVVEPEGGFGRPSRPRSGALPAFGLLGGLLGPRPRRSRSVQEPPSVSE